MSTQAPKRYSPLWVTLHWVIALLIFAAFYLGISTRRYPVDGEGRYSALAHAAWHYCAVADACPPRCPVAHSAPRSGNGWQRLAR